MKAAATETAPMQQGQATRRGHVAPLVAHIIYRLGTGGLENGLVNLINATPPCRFRHIVICLKGYDDFSNRIRSPDVQVFDVNKREGKDIFVYVRIWRLLRSIDPDIVHLRNLATVDLAWVVRLAGIKRIVQGEHGWDTFDLYGSSAKYRLLRRLCRPAISRYITVSRHLKDWLIGSVNIKASRVKHIYNGVDTTLFHPSARLAHTPDGSGGQPVVFGWVGRMADVKNPMLLVRAFARLTKRGNGRQVRLVMVGDGPLMIAVREFVDQCSLNEVVALPGTRNDVAACMRSMDVFVLPSLNEGISNTVLEAMATGLPVIATRVGGNAELVIPDETGLLVEPDDVESLSNAMSRYVRDPQLLRRHGSAGRSRAQTRFSLEAMVTGYLEVYDGLLAE